MLLQKGWGNLGIVQAPLRLPMSTEQVIDIVLPIGLGALGALCGAILLWKYWALPKISKWITEEGSSKLRGWFDSVVADPSGEEAQQIGRLTGVAFSYVLKGLEEMATTKEGREQLAPVLGVVQEHIQQSIFATWGHILQKLKKDGQGMFPPGGSGGEGGLGDVLAAVPPEVLGLGEKLLPKQLTEAGIGIPQLMNLASLVGKFAGPNNGGGGGGARGGGQSGSGWGV